MNTPLQDPDLTLLQTLRDAQPGHVSGEMLAEQLGVSRVSIKGRLDRLKEEGFVIDAVRRQGYALVSEPTTLHPLLLALELQAQKTEINWILLDECGSTNDEAMRRLTDGTESPLVVITRRQSAGRGRLGRRWHSDDSGNLMLSFGVRPDRQPAFMQRFTVWIGLRIAAKLSALSGASVLAKWPNDLLINGRKLAGILTEARLDADRMRELILGLGLNVNSAVETWPVEVRSIATSLSQAVGKTFSMSAVAALVISELANAYHDYIERNIEAEMNELWAQYSAINHHKVTISTHGGDISGEVVGMDASSALQLRLANGEVRTFAAGDVSLHDSYSAE
ncbi:biotin--[acetyl-CoA-carboxylase] ligase [Cerasicoccus arenae]|uniref:Bifunctional ligase/repressor BirA n=1 Tax=Cerasicoccus arenae TaxID=424488 RepID=A0A8J3GEZ4_9BACT|nr:biotin--[acetyl-CoA-carboxylase] ligase [Cerasicoccus arenae]MBK1858416.1 biotin--[acetyl-CoA-carboxylase] ligase [Cerasicoccus arenae]GHC02411.1 bifunctional ligase/repressor BirA [Cerasicoccus arenae]